MPLCPSRRRGRKSESTHKIYRIKSIADILFQVFLNTKKFGNIHTFLFNSCSSNMQKVFKRSLTMGVECPWHKAKSVTKNS